MITRDFTATTFIVHNACTLLLFHRKLHIWVPPGGHIEPHELPHVAALREVREETGFDAELMAKGAWLGKVEVLPQPQCILLEDIAPDHQHVDLVYFARITAGELDYSLREAADARWYSWDDLGGEEIAEDIRQLGRQAIAACAGPDETIGDRSV